MIACPSSCSLHPDKIGPGISKALAAIRANGAGANVFARRASELLGHPVPTSNVSRHLNHYRDPAEAPVSAAAESGERVSDLQILDLVIQQGAQNSKNWKPSIKDTMEAIKLKMQMTGNSAFDDLMSLFDSPEAIAALEDAEEDENALLSPEERSDEGDEELEEPLLDA